MKAKEILFDVIDEIIRKEEFNISNYNRIINPDNFLYRFF